MPSTLFDKFVGGMSFPRRRESRPCKRDPRRSLPSIDIGGGDDREFRRELSERRTWFNQKGLTLVEVLVSLLILAGGCVYVLQALAQSARVQKQVEDRVRLYPFSASKLEWLGMRVSPEKDPFKITSGSYASEKRPYQWKIASTFMNPLEAKAPRESLGTSVVLIREFELKLAEKNATDGMNLLTLSKVTVNEKS